MGLLEGKVALITGAARGQGRAQAVTCAREGADVVLLDVGSQTATIHYPMATPADLAETVRLVEEFDRGAIAIQADVRDQAQLDSAVASAIARFGRIDILIANAGVMSQADFWTMTEEQWDDVVGTNLTGVWKSAKAVAPHMIERGSGSIVIISSVNGIEPGRDYAHYVAAKHGVIGLMKNIARELAPYGVRCNSVAPGAIETPMNQHQAAWDMVAGHPGGTQDEAIHYGYHYGALRGTTFLAPSTVADATLFLNSDLATAITGIVIPVEAGHLLLAGYNHDPAR
ncbi:mycofactocin-coupled SDR family oxidoreductase [Jatrophihabitans sp.]|uniref:mycofactocin-coupled SDR family oxidoreductase n=1 Tax=Jatrophihabitans sp. TaxID=1932789 RepID=UPI0030C74486|nr:oxidoreductase [Jatrophihabitans sp.]